MKRTIVVVAMTAATSPTLVTAQQPTTAPRQTYANTRPIVDHLQPGDRHVRLLSPIATPAFGDLDGRPFVELIVEHNPIIFAGRVVGKQPAFLRRRSLQDYSSAPMEQANWIGSRLTVMVDRVMQTLDGFPLSAGGRVSFVDDGDGSAVINGVRVDTETPWLWPTELGRRYLITGHIKNDQFVPSGMWMEPAGGGSMRAHHSRAGRNPLDLTPPRSPIETPFDDWTIEEALYALEEEMQRRP